MPIECPQCGKQLSSKQIDTKVNIVTCDACGAVFSPPLGEGSAYSDKSKAKIKEVPIPERFKVSHNFDHLLISYRHNPCFGVILAIFAVIWNGVIWTIFVPSFLFVGLEGFNYQAGWEWSGLIFPLFLIPFILVGFFIAAQALAMILNTSTIRVDKQMLSIKHRPIPMPLDKNIASSEITQIYTKQHVTHGSGGDQISYQLHMIRRDGKSKKILDQLPQAEQALFIEQEIEGFLGIEDLPVQGEYH